VTSVKLELLSSKMMFFKEHWHQLNSFCSPPGSEQSCLKILFKIELKALFNDLVLVLARISKLDMRISEASQVENANGLP